MKKFLICFLVGMLFLLPAGEAMADGQLDLDKKGSIDITLRDTNGNIVQGGTITVRKVADARYDNAGYRYVYTEQFANSEYSLEKSSLPELAVELEKYALDNGIAGSIYNNAEGKIEITDLTAGLYLISQGTASAGYSAIVPFFVSMPYQLDGKWIYKVDASPKISPVNQETIAPEPTTEAESKTESETENETESETEDTSSIPDGADTGDKTPIMLYVVLMCIAVLVGGISIACKNNEKVE